jgi:hypothetical protein
MQSSYKPFRIPELLIQALQNYILVGLAIVEVNGKGRGYQSQ